jgi:hypothetical protein
MVVMIHRSTCVLVVEDGNWPDLMNNIDWAESDLHSSRGVWEVDLQATWSHPDLSECVMKGWNSSLKMGEHSRSKSWALGFTNFETQQYSEK